MQSTNVISGADFLSWAVALVIVLLIFVACAWAVKQINKQSFNDTERLRIVGGLSLGMRERLVLVQAGKKQLILGVTPGRIETLHVLDGDDCLNKQLPDAKVYENSFAFKLKQELTQVMKGKADAQT